MQIEINYRTGDTPNFPCVAWSVVRGHSYTRVGATWEEAKERLLEHIKESLSVEVPERETVVLELEQEDLPTFSDKVNEQVAGFQKSVREWVDPKNIYGGAS